MAAQRVSTQTVDDSLILRSHVSEQRKERFLRDYLQERASTQTTERMFALAGSLRLERKLPPPAVRCFGFKLIVFKGSFVEEVNWHLDSAREFAIVQEEFLLAYLEEELRAAAAGSIGNAVERDCEAILAALDQMLDEHQARGRTPSLFVVAGQIGQPLYSDLRARLVSPWDPTVWGTVPSFRIIGLHRNIPILDIPESPSPALYAVDLAQFATLTRYGEGPDFHPKFRVYPFSEDEARALLAKQPRLILDPPPESGDDDERIRQLRLRVGLDLWETYDLKVKDPRAVLGRPIVDPIDE